MKIEDIEAYQIIDKHEIPELQSMSYLLEHKKSGARIALLSNQDENKVFYVGFRTPPTDSTGVAHIIEHSVLCGSKTFPLKDPFVELVKGSLNTFLNAMTYSDKTVYPVASCNDKDFQNLCHVYMDAVFYPNIYTEEKIFRQEGWHYEMENAGDELKINGVVYNEMKGAFSSPDDVHDREVLNSLYPDTTYAVESGGDPKNIPDLSYEEFLNFHRKYYHPANSYIYLYGDMDMAEKLIWMDKEYLSKFDRIQVPSEINMQKPFEKPAYIYKDYPVLEGESLEDNTYLSYNAVVGTSLDKELYYAFDLIDYALCSSAGAPIKQALIEKNIGTEVYSIYENGILQPYYSIVAKNANAEQKELFVETIEQELQKIVTQGINKKALLAGLNYYEFKYREADFGAYPKGLMYGLQMFDSWLYDEKMAFDLIEGNEVYKKLRTLIDTDYYEKLIDKYLLHNNHKTIVVVSPKEGLTEKTDKELAEKLAAYKATLSDAEIEKIVADTKALREYQDKEDSQEALATLPMLTRADMKKEAEGFINEERKAGGFPVLFHPIYTNGIGYVKLIFDASNVPAEYMAYAGILKNVFAYIDTDNYSYGELYNELNIHTGGVAANINTYTNAKKMDEYKIYFEIKCKAFYEELPKAFELITEVLTRSKLDDKKRLREIISELKSRMQGNMVASGHSVAAVRAMSYFSETAAVSELLSGMPFYRLLEKLEDDFETYSDELVEKLHGLVKRVFREENLMIDFTADEEGYKIFDTATAKLKNVLFTEPVEKKAFHVCVDKKNEGFCTSGQIQYVGQAGNYREKNGYPYTGALRILRVIMGYEYLWTNIRVKGGAYGCMCNFAKNGDSYFVSYRDPNLKKTFETYQGIADYVRHFTADERTMTKYIIGTISELDTPMTPATKASRSLGAYLSNQEFEEIQRERDEILTCTQEEIRKLAAYMEAIINENAICVVGNGQAIEENRQMFGEVDHLFH